MLQKIRIEFRAESESPRIDDPLRVRLSITHFSTQTLSPIDPNIRLQGEHKPLPEWHAAKIHFLS